jgi:hypothetical protein
MFAEVHESGCYRDNEALMHHGLMLLRLGHTERALAIFLDLKQRIEASGEIKSRRVLLPGLEMLVIHIAANPPDSRRKPRRRIGRWCRQVAKALRTYERLDVGRIEGATLRLLLALLSIGLAIKWAIGHIS